MRYETRTRETTTKEVLTMTRMARAMGSRLGTGLVECTSGQSEDYPSHWGVYILNTVFVTAGSEVTADSVSVEVEARLISRLARSRASLCLAKVVLRWLGVSKQSQRSPSCPRAGLTN